MNKRDLYLNKLLDFKDTKLIKVVTGIRRCGKSSLMELLKRELLIQGIQDERIIHMNFESLKYDFIKDYLSLYEFMEKKMVKGQKMYIMLDEIQQVESWEKAVNSLSVDYDVDIYITGSNGYLLSSELATLLSGRYVEIRMLPLSFKEYLEFNTTEENTTMETKFTEFMRVGGFPSLSEIGRKQEVVESFLYGIYNTVIMKDVILRNAVKDPGLLEVLIKYVFDNVGNITSPKKISDYLNSEGRKTTSETIDNYLKMLENAFIIYHANRYDVKGKQHLKTLGKYYPVDPGLRNAILGNRDYNYGHALEGVLYLEMCRRYREVSIGKWKENEIDFVVQNSEERIYYQVAASIAEEKTLRRELLPLQAIHDNYRKVILTMDRIPVKYYEGIEVVNIIDFLIS